MIDTERKREDFLMHFTGLPLGFHVDTHKVTRTSQQNRALHVFLGQLADVLNEAGLEQRTVMAAMTEGVERPWSTATTKENLWRPLQVAMTSKESTTDITTVEPSEIHKVLTRWLLNTFPGITVPAWPSRR